MKDHAETLYLRPGKDVPNNPDLPVLVYRDVLPPDADDAAAAFEKRFADNGWKGLWRDGIYDYHHFHSNAHEVLGIARGRVTVQLGGEDGATIALATGDIVVLPAGTGHKRVNASRDLLVIGAYPPGQENYDMCRSREEWEETGELPALVPIPETDPFFGTEGPLTAHWQNGTARKSKQEEKRLTVQR